MAIATIRRLAADILNVGENKIRIAPDNVKEAEGALTRADVRGLIDKGIIIRLKPQGRASTRKKDRRSVGKRRGIMIPPKVAWMMKVRAQRRLLRTISADGALKKGTKRSVYGKVKSGIFRNKRAMLIYLKDNGLVAKEYEPKKPVFQKKAGKPGTPPKQKPLAGAASAASAQQQKAAPAARSASAQSQPAQAQGGQKAASQPGAVNKSAANKKGEPG
jgi:large subunit ribosomal protein L19e